MRSAKRFSRTVVLSLLVLLTVGAALFTGCDSSDGPPSELFTNWVLQEFTLDGGGSTPVPGGQSYFVTFTGDGSASIRLDCNLCNGPYSVDGDRLSFGLMTCTLAACGPDSLDTQFQAALATVSTFEIVDGVLFLDYEGGVMRFTSAEVIIQ
jgi:heat shock protein HslJ